MCDKAVDLCPFAFCSVPDQCNTQEMCYEFVSNKPFILKYCLDKYKIQKCVIKLLILVY